MLKIDWTSYALDTVVKNPRLFGFRIKPHYYPDGVAVNSWATGWLSTKLFSTELRLRMLMRLNMEKFNAKD